MCPISQFGSQLALKSKRHTETLTLITKKRWNGQLHFPPVFRLHLKLKRVKGAFECPRNLKCKSITDHRLITTFTSRLVCVSSCRSVSRRRMEMHFDELKVLHLYRIYGPTETRRRKERERGRKTVSLKTNPWMNRPTCVSSCKKNSKDLFTTSVIFVLSRGCFFPKRTRRALDSRNFRKHTS